MISHDDLLEEIRAQFPEGFVRRAEGGLKLRGGRMRLASHALVARLVRAGRDVELQGALPTIEALVEAAAGLAPLTARAVGLRLPPPPPRFKCNQKVAALGIDLAVADAVVDLLWSTGLEHRRGCRFLHLNCGLGHGVRGLQLALPGNEWVGLDPRPAVVDWASRHVEGAEFHRQPAHPPVDAPDGSFDGVIALETFAASLSQDAMQAWLAEIGRLVKPGGIAVLAVNGYARLVREMSRGEATIAELANAHRSLVETGRAMLTANGRSLTLHGPRGLPAEGLGADWQVGQPTLGQGPGGRDLYLARRAERAERTGEEVASIEIADQVEATRLALVGAGYGLRRIERVAEAGRIARRAPVLIDDQVLPPDHRHNLARYHRQRQTDFAALHLMRFADALIAGEGSVVLADGGRHWLLADSAREFLNAGEAPKGMGVGRNGGPFALPGRVHRSIDACCLLLQRPWSENFGHWLVDQAAALAWLAETGALPTRHIVVTKTRKLALRQVMRQTIDAILPDAIVHEHDVGEVWRCRDLAWSMPVHVPPLFKLPAALESLRARLLPSPALRSSPTRRLHVLRSRASSRQLLNEAEIVQISARYGFETVAPEAYPLGEQARMFGQAEAVIGVKGAALTNIVFAPPSSRVIVLSPGDFIDPFYWDIASGRHMPYAELFGELATRDRPVSWNDFTIDPARFEAALRRMLSG